MSGTPNSHMIIAGIGFSSGYAYFDSLGKISAAWKRGAHHKGDGNFTANGRDD
jgi:hypothetical protein